MVESFVKIIRSWVKLIQSKLRSNVETKTNPHPLGGFSIDSFVHFIDSSRVLLAGRERWVYFNLKPLHSEDIPCNFNALIKASKCKKSDPPNKWREISITENSVDLGRFIWEQHSKSFIKWDVSKNQLTRLIRKYENPHVYWKLIGPDLNLTLKVDARYPQMIDTAKASTT